MHSTQNSSLPSGARVWGCAVLHRWLPQVQRSFPNTGGCHRRHSPLHERRKAPHRACPDNVGRTLEKSRRLPDDQGPPLGSATFLLRLPAGANALAAIHGAVAHNKSDCAVEGPVCRRGEDPNGATLAVSRTQRHPTCNSPKNILGPRSRQGRRWVTAPSYTRGSEGIADADDRSTRRRSCS